MKELACQSLVIRAAKQYNGMGWKLANRFLAGIPDVLVQIPGLGTSLWEVKKVNMPLGAKPVMVKCTDIQYKTLKDYHEAGGKCGIIAFSFRPPDYAWVGVLRFKGLIGPKTPTHQRYFVSLVRGKREDIIFEGIRRAIDGFEEGSN